MRQVTSTHGLNAAPLIIPMYPRKVAAVYYIPQLILTSFPINIEVLHADSSYIAIYLPELLRPYQRQCYILVGIATR